MDLKDPQGIREDKIEGLQEEAVSTTQPADQHQNSAVQSQQPSCLEKVCDNIRLAFVFMFIGLPLMTMFICSGAKNEGEPLTCFGRIAGILCFFLILGSFS